jgi:hypothetical protein
MVNKKKERGGEESKKKYSLGWLIRKKREGRERERGTQLSKIKTGK